jgi:hypothetical protein
MTTLITKKLFLIPAVFGLLVLSTGCGPASPVVGYTGNAIVKAHSTSGKNCLAHVELPDGKRGSLTVGKKSVCTGYKDGITIKIENGKYKGKA